MFNLESEKEQMKATIADSSIAATNLMNSLKSINREKERISENRTAVERFESCKQLRRKVLRYVCALRPVRCVPCLGEGPRWGRIKHEKNCELTEALLDLSR